MLNLLGFLRCYFLVFELTFLSILTSLFFKILKCDITIDVNNNNKLIPRMKSEKNNVYISLIPTLKTLKVGSLFLNIIGDVIFLYLAST